jgi:hypothetical protein
VRALKAVRAGSPAPKALRAKSDFASDFKPIWVVQMEIEKYFALSEYAYGL